MRIGYLLSLTSLLLFSLALTGCSTDDDTTASSSHDQQTEDAGHHDDGHDHDHDHDHAHDHGDEEIDPNLIAVNLAKLSEEDRLLAEKQKICLVGGEALGSMGAPEKLDVDGTTIFICCRACEREILTNKEKYIKLVKGTESEDPDDGGDDDNDAGDSSE
mgnify:FL=1|jgi:hypothetical protein